MSAAVRLLVAIGAAAMLAGCVPARGGWDHVALAERHPALDGERHRLRDLAPHLSPGDGELVLLLCRWPADAAIPVRLPDDASGDERAMLGRALDAWAATGLGVRFVEAPTGAVGIDVRFVEQGDPGPIPVGAGDTIADCRIGARQGPGRVAASLVFASIHLRRDETDWLGGSRPLDAEERRGAALHELGHALGFASHVAAGDSLMRASPETARHAAAKLTAGEWPGDRNLRALYAVPSGTIVGRLPLSVAAAETLARFVAAAASAQLDGPFSRVGTSGARLFYRDARGRPFALRVRPWPPVGGVLHAFEPNARAVGLLDGAGTAAE